MLTVDLKYLLEHRDRHGNWRMYVRRGKRMIRIREKPGTPEFFEAYRLALKALNEEPASPQEKPRTLAQAAPGSFAWLCQRYCASAEFKILDGRTMRIRRRILERLCEGNDGADGNKPYRRMEAQHIAQRRDENSDRPEAANAIVKALRQVFAWATLPHVKLAESNPARDVPYLPSNNPEGHHTWTLDEVSRYEAKFELGTKPRLAIALLLYTGVRRCDVVRLGRQMVRDGWLHFTETKGRKRHPKPRAIPILPELQAAITAGPAGNLTYLVSERGRPFSEGSFGNRFRKWCDEAGLPQCSAHGLRKAGATIAADNGATEHQLMAIYGWESPKQAALYTRKANRRKLIGDAMHLISVGRSDNKSESPQEAVPPSDSFPTAKLLKSKK